MDIMYVNGIPFLTTISRIVRFDSSTEMIGANMNNAVIVLKVVSATYKARGFIIVTVDNKQWIQCTQAQSRLYRTENHVELDS